VHAEVAKGVTVEGFECDTLTGSEPRKKVDVLELVDQLGQELGGRCGGITCPDQGVLRVLCCRICVVEEAKGEVAHRLVDRPDDIRSRSSRPLDRYSGVEAKA
jgi:hypothetical protein